MSSDADPPGGAHRPLPRWLVRGVVAPCVIVIVVSMGLVLTFGHGRDQSIYALVARETLAGGMPYRDAFDFKPPGIFAVYALARALFGASPVGIRVLEVGAMAATTGALLHLARRELRLPLAGWVAAALACGVHAQLDFWHTAQPETFGEPLGLGALALAASAARSPSAGRRAVLLAAAGVLLGVAGLMKPPLAGGAAVVAGFAAWSLGRSRRGAPWSTRVREAAAPFAFVGAGVAAPIALCLAVFAARGALDDLHEVLFVFTPHYTRLSWEKATVSGMLYRGVVEWLTVYSSAILGGVVLAAILPWPARTRPLLIATLALCLVHVAGVAMQGKFFPYHWGATFAPTALVAATGWVLALERAAQRHPAAGAAVVATAAVVAWLHAPVPSFGQVFLHRSARRAAILLGPGGAERTAALDALASVADVDAGHNRAAAALIAERVPEGAPIFVWGFEPAIYDLAHRPLASRFIYDVPQRAAWSRDAMRAALLRDLEAQPPAAIVVEHHDVMPAVTGDKLDSAASLEGFDGLRHRLSEGYTLAGRTGDLEVWLRAARPGVATR